MKKREASAPTYLARVKDCLKRVAGYAAEKNIRLGVEGRRGYEEIPNERELPALLDEINCPHSVTGTTWDTFRSKKISASSTTKNGRARLARARSAVTCRIASGRDRTTNRHLPAMSIWKSLCRFFPPIACMFGN